MPRTRFDCLLSLVLVSGAVAHAQCDPRPLREFNFTTAARSSTPAALGIVGGRAVFTADTPEYGREAWSTDGTPAGTRLLVDATPGTAASAVRTMASTSRGLFFRAGVSTSTVSSLYVTDGTQAGTVRLIPTVSGQGVIVAAADRGDGGVAVLVSRGTTTELWGSDGTLAGTVLIRTFTCCAADETYDHFESLGGRLYFAAGDTASGKEIWSTDGLPGGTTQAEANVGADPAGSAPIWMRGIGGKLYFSGTIGSAVDPYMLTPGASVTSLNPTPVDTNSPYLFTSVGGGASGAPVRVVFWTTSASIGREMWSTQGQAGDAAIVRDVDPGFASCAPDPSVSGTTAVVGDRVVYAGATSAAGYELFVSDGTAAGTRLLRELVPGAGNGVSLITSVTPDLAIVDGIASTSEPWLTDGTDGGTIPIATLIPDPVTGARRTAGVSGGRVYIATSTALYRTDGTPAGTQQVGQLPVGQTWSTVGQVQELGSRIVCTATEFSGATVAGSRGSELWVIDPAAQTIQMLADLNPADGSSQPFNGFVPLFNSANPSLGPNPALFIGRIPSVPAIWAIGTDPAQRTNLLSFMPPGPVLFPTSLNRSMPFGSGTVLSIIVQNSATMLVRTDGTPAGTWPIITIPLFVQAAPTLPPPITECVTGPGGSIIVASGFQANAGQELWASPGAPDSGGLLLDIYPGGGSSNPSGLTSMGNLAFFAAFTPSTGYEPWITDGTVAGTFKLREIAPSGLSSIPIDGLASTILPAFFNGRVYFGATDGSNNRVWSTDGTAAGTTALVIPQYAFTTPPRRFYAGRSLLFFEATTAAAGTEIFATDGTAAGTRLLGEAVPGPLSSAMREIAVGRDRIFFVPSSTAQGVELWSSDGTAAGTSMARDIVPGAGSSTPQNLTVVGNVCYFTLATPSGIAQGSELWRSDGTEAGTCMVADINPIGSSLPMFLRAVGGRLYFYATSLTHGMEPWVLETCPSDFNNSGDLSVQDIFDYLNAWFSGSLLADFNVSGGLSAQDIFDFLASWFGGC